MLNWLFGSKKSAATSGPKTSAPAPKPKAPAPVKLRKVNIEKKFSIIAETGQGSMSKVYRAVEQESGRIICLKLQDKEKTVAALTRANQVGRPSEGEIGAKIVHPNVVRTFDFGLTSKGEYFLVMEYVDGVSMNFIRQSRPELARMIELLAQSADGLAAVHAAGFMHHDFGPKNLLVDKTDTVKLIDFGLAVPNTPQFQRPGNRTGTLQYMAPELVRRESISERIDLFSWGVSAFEILTGKLPYDATDPMAMIRQRINLEPTDIQEMAPKLPPDLCAIIRKTLVRKPGDRWPKASTLGAALRALPAAQGYKRKSDEDRPYD